MIKFPKMLILVLSLISFASSSYAGGAVAASQQKNLREQQIIQQKLILQRQTILEQQHQQQMTGMDNSQQEEVAEIVDIQDLWKSFETSSEGWLLIMDPQAKVFTTARYIETYHQKKIFIKKSPVDYARMIDDMANNSPEMFKNPFERILMIAAIIEYDFENGQDKDQMALQILGRQGFLANKQRLGLK